MCLKIFIGSDHAGFKLKKAIKEKLKELGFKFTDIGTNSEESCDYPDFALSVAQNVVKNPNSQGILVCGTGMGMALTANKVPGIRAAVVFSEASAKQCREHGDTNVLCLGEKLLNQEDALKFVEIFLKTKFEGSKPENERHLRRLNKIKEIEKQFLKPN